MYTYEEGYTTEYDEFIVENERSSSIWGVIHNRNETYFGGEKTWQESSGSNDLAGFGRMFADSRNRYCRRWGAAVSSSDSRFECTDRV